MKVKLRRGGHGNRSLVCLLGTPKLAHLLLAIVGVRAMGRHCNSPTLQIWKIDQNIKILDKSRNLQRTKQMKFDKI